jgi:hypothetical protein
MSIFLLMKNIALKSVLAVVLLSSLALGGCAADSETDGDEQPVTADVNTDETKPSYDPRVTIKDITAGNGTCVGTYCQINGRDWDCSGGGYCKLLGHSNQ